MTAKNLNMEQKLTNQEIAKAFAMYLGSDSECIIGYQKGVMESVNISDCMCEVGYEIDDEESGFYGDYTSELFNSSEIKLILRDLSSITDEDAIVVAKLILFEHKWRDGKMDNPSLLHHGKFVLRDGLSYHCPWDIYQYLIQKGYAVPLFFGVDHWATGKTAIELNIATNKK